METTIETKITDVTIYTDRALITRKGQVNLTGEEKFLIVSNLPTSLEKDSIRVSGKGNIPVKIQGVSLESKFTTKSVNQDIARINAEIEEKEVQKNNLQIQIESFTVQTNFISGLREQTAESFSRSLARQQIGLDDTLNLINFIGNKHQEYARAIANLRQEQTILDKELQALRSTLNQFKNPPSKETIQIKVGIENQLAGEFELVINYVVYGASWSPLYDLRVQNNNIIKLTYLAEITQRTGENWSNINLILSTAKPGLGNIPPYLNPWYIDYQLPIVMSRAMSAPMMAASAAPMVAEETIENDYDYLDMEYTAETSVADVSQKGSIVTFNLGGGGNIPSDGNPHKATILYDELPCQLTYLTMPKLVSFAYVQSKAKNRDDGATLLPGKANIFREEIFVGSTDLENIAPGQEFKLNLGIDEGIKIDRELIERQVDKKFLGNNRRITYAYRITITNLLNQTNFLELHEQIPHSRHEQIKVKLTKTNPSIQLGELGRLTWELNLPAHSKIEIYYQFTIEHPENMHIQGLTI